MRACPRALAAAIVGAVLLASDPARAQSLSWVSDTVATRLVNPCRVAFGPDGRLYVLELRGRLLVYTLGPNRKPVAVQTVNTISGAPDGIWATLGLAFDPLSPQDSVRVYVTRTKLYQPAGSGAYLGRVTRLTGPSFAQAVDVITGLPVSRMDHATNGLVFANDGNLYIQQGGNTNSGVPGDGLNGNREEGPLSGATLVAYVRRPGFDGAITYSDPDPGLAAQTGGFDVEVYTPGFRNPFGIAQHSNDRLYGTDNGPNSYFDTGTLWRCDSIGPAVDANDKVVLLERDDYHGHPNRNRAALDPRQCSYHWPTDPTGDGFTAPLRVVTPSSNGILEYRADTFGGALRGDLLVARYEGTLSRAQLAADGRSITTYTQPFPMYGCLDVAQAPDGTVYGVRYATGEVRAMIPNDPGPAARPHARMMWPQAGPASAGRWARLVGTRLGTSGAPLAVTLGGAPCAVTAWDSSSVTLNVPALPAGWHDAIVVTAEGADTLARAYRAIQLALTSGDRTPPLVDVSRPERRYWDRTPPAVQVTAHDRLGMDSLAIRFDGGPWQTLAAGIADTSVSTAVVVPYAQWAAATDGPHAISIRARDDAGNVTLDDWTWIKGLPSSGIWRLNCGGPEYVSSTGATFGADTGPAYGTTLGTSQSIAGTADPALYQTARTTADSLTPLVYALPTGNRAYQLRLHVAEIDSACAAPGRRVFDVFGEADTLVRGLDPSTGGAFRAVERDAEALVTDGQLDLVLRATRARPLLSALEVIPLGLDDATPPSIAPLPQPAGLTWANPPVLTLQASDPADGELFALHYAIDGGPWRAVRSALAARSYASAWAMPPAAFQAAGPGPHTLVVRAVDLAGATAETPPWAFTVSDVVAAPAGPAAANVRAWPNPTRGRRLSVSFAPTRAGEASVEVFDVSGRRVHARDLGWREAGPATFALDGALRGAGLWFVRVRAPGVDRTLRVVALD